MKKILSILMALMILIGGFSVQAPAQVINHDAIVNVLQSMKQDINQMIQLVERHKAATISVGNEQVEFTAVQLTQLINKYGVLKTGLAAKYQQLP